MNPAQVFHVLYEKVVARTYELRKNICILVAHVKKTLDKDDTVLYIIYGYSITAI